MKGTRIQRSDTMRTPDLNWLKDSRIFQVNRLQAYSDHKYTIGKDKKPSSFSLNGTWKFNQSKNYDTCFKFFYNTEFNDANWNDIQVPGHIQLQGFDNPHYTDVTYPWDGHDVVKPGQIDMDKNKVYQYRKTFDLPQDFIGNKLILSFEGVESNIYVWLMVNLSDTVKIPLPQAVLTSQNTHKKKITYLAYASFKNAQAHG